jgi:hypothetical protein
MSMDPVTCQPTVAHGPGGYSKWTATVASVTIARLGLEVSSCWTMA